jgi:CubicO group peptidase (beta-lactamase class C family)
VARFPSCVGLAIGIRQGDLRFDRFFGDAGNGQPPNANSEFEIGSITKTFTATLLAYEDRQGRARINDPLSRFAPPGMAPPNFNGQPILMVHLADHTSGLPRRVPINRPPLMPEMMWRYVSGYRLQHAPGTNYLYSNLGYGLLARAIVRLERANEEQLYARIITQPLGMRDTVVRLSPNQRARLAQGYGPKRRRAPESVIGFPAVIGAGGLWSTLNDMMRYLDFQLGRINMPLSPLLPVLHQPLRSIQPRTSVGLGWHMHGRNDGLNTIYKDGAMPGYSSFMTMAPSIGAGVVVLSNQGRCRTTQIGAQILGGLAGSAASEVETPPLSEQERE